MPEAVATRNAPAAPASSRGRGWLKSPVVLGALAIAVVAVVGSSLGSLSQSVVTVVLIHAIVGAGLVVLVGTAGQLSLGQAAFLAVGAYAGAKVATLAGIGLPLELLVGIGLATAVGLVTGLPSLRLTGLLLAVGTLALGFALQQLLYAWEPVTGGGAGLAVPNLTVFGLEPPLLATTAVVMAITFYVVHNLLRARTGRAWHALRTSDAAARAMGIEVGARRVLAFVISAAITACGGVLYAHSVSFLSPDTFSIDLSIKLVIMAIIGGQRRLLGAVLGAAFVIGLPEQFRAFQEYEGVFYGVILLLVIIFAPGGLVELAERGWRLVTDRRSRPEATENDDVEVHLHADVGAVAEYEEHGQVAVSRPAEELTLDNISVAFGGVRAVSDVSFTVAPGEVLGLIGPNGAGKTTLFNAVCGVVPSTGGVHYGDQTLSGTSVRTRALAGIGRTFQSLALHEGLTVLDHVLIGRHRFYRYTLLAEMLRLPSVTRAEKEGIEEATAILTALGLESVMHRVVDDLPYGVQKRVDVARTLASSPSILLLDEPAAGLPHDEADDLLDQVLAITRPHGTSVIIIEHNVDLVRRVCDRLVVLSSGSIIAEGEPREILASTVVKEAYLGA